MSLQHPAAKTCDFSTIKSVLSGAAPLSAEITNQVARMLPNAAIGQGYGMTETRTSFSFPQIDMRVGTPGSAGASSPASPAASTRRTAPGAA